MRHAPTPEETNLTSDSKDDVVRFADAALAAEERIDATVNDDIEDANMRAWAEAMDRLSKSPAKSLYGLSKKAEAMRKSWEGVGYQNRLVTSLLDDVRRLTAAEINVPDGGS